MFQVIAATGAAVATIAVAVLDIACSWSAGGTSAGVRPMSGTINPTVTVALRSLEATEADLQRTVTEAATGRAVATVEDNPAVYVIAQRLAMQSGEVRDQVRRRHAVRPNVERRREQRRLGGFRPGTCARICRRRSSRCMAIGPKPSPRRGRPRSILAWRHVR